MGQQSDEEVHATHLQIQTVNLARICKVSRRRIDRDGRHGIYTAGRQQTFVRFQHNIVDVLFQESHTQQSATSPAPITIMGFGFTGLEPRSRSVAADRVEFAARTNIQRSVGQSGR